MRHNNFRKIWAAPRMADNCALPKISGRLNLPYQAFALPEIVSQSQWVFLPLSWLCGFFKFRELQSWTKLLEKMFSLMRTT